MDDLSYNMYSLKVCWIIFIDSYAQLYFLAAHAIED